MLEVIINVRSGMVEKAIIPEGVRLIVKDYDVTSTDSDDLLQIDADGTFVEFVFDKE